jgi:tRNA (guanine-N7-)-methyltransferase
VSAGDRSGHRDGTTTYGGRTGRMGPMRQHALAETVPLLRVDVDSVRRAAAAGERIIVEIGCGKGDATVAMAQSTDADGLVIACEVNVAMIAALAMAVEALSIENVRLWPGDAFALLSELDPGSLDEVRVWFPDPWPKIRHAPKRLVTPDRIATITAVLRPGGRLRLATDDAAYAAEACASLTSEPRLRVDVVERPAERPVTAFEARAGRDARTVTDLVAVRIS